jgi:hypothetical protein
MKEYRRKLENEEKVRKMQKEKTEQLGKGWELMRICRTFIEENSKTWKDEENIRKQKKDE